ncbi:hypothetical protein [Kitasatospora sp. NPDC098663]|uniref:hypothetical protein n=1 Tax=Kitasatospora sp. NPDC098663 TaxID=3364096 RepID=UPI0037FB1412
MSKSGNVNRLAKKIRDNTSLTLTASFRLAQQVNVRPGPPTADAPEPRQRRFEAHLAHVLAARFQDHQLNGALLGVREAVSNGQRLDLLLEPAMAEAVICELLPRFDHSYGGIRGVPGLRVMGDGRRWTLHAIGLGRVAAARTDSGLIRLPLPRDDEVALWGRAPDDLSRDEKREIERWVDAKGVDDLHTRDLLMSRLLRRPELVNRTSEPHGFANCYNHHAGDLVIEWCCGDTVEELCASLLAHGFIDGVPRASAVELVSQHSARLGDATIILNRHASCLYGDDAQTIAEHIKRGYES